MQTTIRDHCNAVWERTGKMPARLADAPKCPDGLLYLWNLFIRLRRRSTPSMGRARILYTDLQAYQSVTGDRLRVWEIDAIERLDDIEVSDGG